MATWRSDARCVRRFPPPVDQDAVISGILNVHKPQGITSHDVVARLRRLAGQRRVGHAGTLDPLATGVLVVCLGQATRIAEYLTLHDKSYVALVRLGQTSDTYDAEGVVMAESAGPLPVRDDVEAALSQFRGTIEQRPPAFSAIKVDGQPLYRRARRGEKIEPPARTVHIHRLQMIDWEPPLLQLEVDCSAGTYIRSLAHDLGLALGCGAHLVGLTRTRSGRFLIEDAHRLDELERESEGRLWLQHLLPIDFGILEFDALDLTAEDSLALVHGRGVSGPLSRKAALARAYSPEGELLAIVEFDDEDQQWRPKKVFGTVRR